MIRAASRWMVAIVMVAVCLPVMAHPGHETSGFGSGFAHPLQGADHVLAMIAVGLWAAQLGKRALWLVPGAFVACVVLGSLLTNTALPIPVVESGILASVVVLGIVIALALQAPTFVAAAGVGLFALFHGYAHGLEITGSVSAWSYTLGFVLATAMLHGVGVVLALAFRRFLSDSILRYAGGAVTAAGLLMFLAI